MIGLQSQASAPKGPIGRLPSRPTESAIAEAQLAYDRGEVSLLEATFLADALSVGGCTCGGTGWLCAATGRPADFEHGTCCEHELAPRIVYDVDGCPSAEGCPCGRGQEMP